MTQPKRVGSFAEFWPLYVREHRNAGCRMLHFVGSSLSLAVVAIAMATRIEWLLLAPVVGYGVAWTGHYCLEHNRPATFKHPIWSFIADWKMWTLMLVGRMDEEIKRVEAIAVK
ncbi:MAG: DUF962 domain-containing protein [Pirellulales bacterium]